MVAVLEQRARPDLVERQAAHEGQEHTLAPDACVLGKRLVTLVLHVVLEPALHGIFDGEDGFPLLDGRQADLDAPGDLERFDDCAIVIPAKKNSSVDSASA